MRLPLAGVTLIALATACAHTPKPATDELVVRPHAAPPSAPAAQPAPPAPAPATAPVANAHVALDAALAQARVFFEFDRDRLTDESVRRLQPVGEALRRQSDVRVRIEGNCDEVGTEEYNLLLGQRRAEAARKYLLDLGVKPGQLDTISYGAQRPLASGHTGEAWAQNRRDDVVRVSN